MAVTGAPELLIVMGAAATPDQVDDVVARLEEAGCGAVVTPGREATVIGAIGERGRGGDGRGRRARAPRGAAARGLRGRRAGPADPQALQARLAGALSRPDGHNGMRGAERGRALRAPH